MNKSERPVDWKIQAGVNSDIISRQMPYILGFRGEVKVSNLPDGKMVISGEDVIRQEYVSYRYNPETQTAELINNRTSVQRSGEPEKSLLEKIDFNHYLQPEKAFEMLAILMGAPVEKVKTMFPEATNFDQILLDKEYGGAKFRICFNLPGKPSLFSCMYDYSLATGAVEHSYSNDGKGKVWAKWNEKSK